MQVDIWYGEQGLRAGDFICHHHDKCQDGFGQILVSQVKDPEPKRSLLRRWEGRRIRVHGKAYPAGVGYGNHPDTGVYKNRIVAAFTTLREAEAFVTDYNKTVEDYWNRVLDARRALHREVDVLKQSYPAE